MRSERVHTLIARAVVYAELVRRRARFWRVRHAIAASLCMPWYSACSGDHPLARVEPDAAQPAHDAGATATDAELDGGHSDAADAEGSLPDSSSGELDAADADAADENVDAGEGDVGGDASDAPFSERGAVFEVLTDHGDEAYDWRDRPGGNSACVWESARMFYTSIGEQGPMELPGLDFNICHFDGPGLYRGVDPFHASCDNDQRYFYVFWHNEAQEGAVFASKPSTRKCELEITREQGDLIGRFDCGELVSPGKNPREIAARGVFRCVDPGSPPEEP